MNILQIFALCFLVFGVFMLGWYVGESYVFRHDRHRNLLRSEGPDNYCWFMGVVSIAIAIVLAIIAAYPAEKVLENAEKIRSQYTTEALK